MKLAIWFLVVFGFVTALTAQQQTERKQQDKRGLGIQPTTNKTATGSKSDSPAARARDLPELVLQSGHTGQVTTIAFSPDGRWLASGSRDSTIRIWDVASGAQLRTLTGHKGSVSRLSISPDRRWLVSSTWKEIKVWDVEKGREVQAYTKLFNVAEAISSDRRLLAAVQEDGTLKIWDLLTGKEVPESTPRPKHAKSLAFSPDASKLAVGANDYTIKILEVVSGNEVVSLSNANTWATSLAFSHDGKWLASGNAVMSYRGSAFSKTPLGALDGGVSIWELETKTKLWTRTGHNDNVNDLFFSPDGQWLISTDATNERKKLAWANANGSSPTWMTRGLFSLGAAVAFTGDGKLVATGKEVTATTSAAERWSIDGTFQVHSLAFSPDKHLLAVGHGTIVTGGVDLYDLTSKKLVTELKAQTAPINMSAFPSEGQVLAIGQQDDLSTAYGGTSQRVHLWDTATGVPIQSIVWPITDDLAEVSFQADGKSFAVRSRMHMEIFDVSTGSVQRRVDGLRGGMNSNSYLLSRDGRRVIAYKENSVAVLDAQTGSELRTIPKTTVIEDLALSPDGRQIAIMGFGDRKDLDEIKVFDVDSGQLLRTIETASPFWRIAFSEDGRKIAGGALAHSDERIKVWSLETGAVLQTFSLPYEGNLAPSVGSLTFSKDGSLLAATHSTNSATIWDLRQGKLLHELRAHTANLSGVSFSPDDRVVATSSFDGSAILWDVQSGNELARLFSLRKGTDWLVMTPDGLFDGSPGSWNGVLWRFGGNTFDTAPVEAFFNEFYYPGLLGEILSGNRPTASRAINQLDRRQPTLRLSTSVTNDAAVSARQVELTIDIAQAAADATHTGGSGVQDVRLFRNGSLVRAWRGAIKLDSTGKAVLKATVPIVSGDNRFSVYAFNRDNIKSSDAVLSIKGAENLRRKGTAYVIAVGINQYSNSDYNLKYAVADAQEFSAEIAKQQTGLAHYEKVVTVPLLDGDATKTNISEALRRLANSETKTTGTFPTVLEKVQPAQPEDVVIVFFASHGLARGDRFYLIPTDMGYAGPRSKLTERGLQQIVSSSMSDLELERAFEKIDARQLLLVIDACNSGQALEAEEKRRGPMNSKGLAQLAYEKGMYVLTAAQGYQAALEAAQLGHGYLTYALVEEGLKTRSADTSPADGQVSIREWLDFATRRVPQMQQNKIQEQQKQGRQLELVIKFAESDSGKDRSLQRPRVFYRREAELNPLVVAKP